MRWLLAAASLVVVTLSTALVIRTLQRPTPELTGSAQPQAVAQGCPDTKLRPAPVLPEAAARVWSAGMEVGLYSEQSWGLTIAVEKDFKCLEPRPGEVDTDAFERPEVFNPKNCAISPDDTEAR